MTSRLLKGIPASSGVGVGRVLLLHAEPLPIVPEAVPPERLEAEIQSFHTALESAGSELEELKRQVLRALGERYAGIFEAQKLILEDPILVDQTVQRMRVGRVSARWALKQVVGELKCRFDAVDDEYIRERGGELADVHRRVQRLLRRESARENPPRAEGSLVVVAHTVGPSDAVLLAGRRIVGLATDVGGRTSHTAILAQALSLPAVVGLRDLTQRVRAGDPIIVDGDAGQVILAPGRHDAEDAERRRAASKALEQRRVSSRDLPAVTRDGVEIAIRANIEFPSEVERAMSFGAQGIGLYRSEFLFLSRSPQLPSEDEHYRTYLEIAQRVAPYPAVVRTLDLGGEKFFHDVLVRDEANPVLGLRAIRLCLKRPDIFLPQLRGLMRAAAAQDNLRILLPLVTAAEQVREVRRLIGVEKDRLAALGLPARSDFPLGVMVEVPAAAAAAGTLAQEADFFSIGTNDLIQYALAVDRGNESVAHLYDPLHPGVLRLIAMVVEEARAAGIGVAVCGEMAADRATIGPLLRLGLRELSVQPRAVGAVREVVRRWTIEEGGDSGEPARAASSAPEVEGDPTPTI